MTPETEISDTVLPRIELPPRALWVAAAVGTAVLAAAPELRAPLRYAEVPVLLVLPGALIVALVLGDRRPSVASPVLAVCASLAVVIAVGIALTGTGVRLTGTSVALTCAGVCAAMDAALAWRRRPVLVLDRSDPPPVGDAARWRPAAVWTLGGLAAIALAAGVTVVAWPAAVSPPYVALGAAGRPTVAGGAQRVPVALSTDRAGTYRVAWRSAGGTGSTTVHLRAGRRVVVMAGVPGTGRCPSLTVLAEREGGGLRASLFLDPCAVP